MRLCHGCLTAIVLSAGCRAGAEEEQLTPNVRVHTAAVTRATLHRYVTAYGTVEPEPGGGGRPAAGAIVSPQVAGLIAAVDVIDGQPVTRGAVLFRLDSRLAEVAVERARQALAFAEQAARRQEELLRSAVTSQRAVEEARLRLDEARSELADAETRLGYHRIVAPLTGTVVRLNARVGQSVDPGSVLASVVDVTRLVVSAKVPSGETAGLRPGLHALLGADTSASGVVTVVGRDVNPLDDTYRVLVSVPAGAVLPPGGFTGVRIEVETRHRVFAVPEECLVSRSGEGTWLMVVRGDSAIRLPVAAGLRDRGLVEVSGEGLSEGLMVVGLEAYSLPRASRIRVAGR